MGVLNKSEIAVPVLPKETVEVTELGGEVVVQGLLLKDRLAMFSGKDQYGRLSRLLEATVTDAAGLPVYTRDEWEIFGAKNFNAAMQLFDVASRLSGLNAELAEKK